jgi:hypothetical protein
VLSVLANFRLLIGFPSIRNGVDSPELISFRSVLLAAWYGEFEPALVATAFIAIMTLSTELASSESIRLIGFGVGYLPAISPIGWIQRGQGRAHPEAARRVSAIALRRQR